MAKPAKRKRRPTRASAKSEGPTDLVAIAPPASAKRVNWDAPENREKMAELARMWRQGMENFSESMESLLAPPTLPVSFGIKNRVQPKQELCQRIFGRLFPDGRIPDEVERGTTELRQMITVALEREAKETGKKQRPTPSWDVVQRARRKPIIR